MVGILCPYFPSLKTKMIQCSSASNFTQRDKKTVSSKDGREVPNGLAAQKMTGDFFSSPKNSRTVGGMKKGKGTTGQKRAAHTAFTVVQRIRNAS